MKRYSFAAFPRHHQLEENPTGEWVRWEDVERYMNKMIEVHKENEKRVELAYDRLERGV